MQIDVIFTLSTGGKYTNRTSDFETVADCHQQIAVLMAQETGTITVNQPAGTKAVLAIRHIVALELAPAGDQ